MICRTCKIDKELSNFYKRNDTNKYRTQCKSCWSANSKKYRKENKEKVSGLKLKWQRENKVKKAVIAHRYYNNHKQSVNEYIKKWKRESRSIESRIIDNYRSRINKAIKRRSESTKNLLGCSIKELMKYISNQFEKGMSWDNYGDWHIDHIKPCASFNLKEKSELIECFNYKNLQPLWAIDNQRKKDKLTGK